MAEEDIRRADFPSEIWIDHLFYYMTFCSISLKKKEKKIDIGDQ